MSTQKRKKVTLTLEQKLEILRQLDIGYSGKRLASDYNVTESSITYIKQQKIDYNSYFGRFYIQYYFLIFVLDWN